MINKAFWQMVADNWHKDDDGISIPDIEVDNIKNIVPEIGLERIDVNDEIDDILSDLGLDDF